MNISVLYRFVLHDVHGTVPAFKGLNRRMLQLWHDVMHVFGGHLCPDNALLAQFQQKLFKPEVLNALCYLRSTITICQPSNGTADWSGEVSFGCARCFLIWVSLMTNCVYAELLADFHIIYFQGPKFISTQHTRCAKRKRETICAQLEHLERDVDKRNFLCFR